MMYEARHAPVMEELPGVGVIISSLTLTTHHTSSLLLLTLQLPLLCVMMSVVTMMMTLPPPLTPHASPLPRWQWPAPVSQSPPVTAPWARRINQRMDGEDALMLALMTHIIFYTMYKVFSQAQDHELVLPVDVSGQPLPLSPRLSLHRGPGASIRGWIPLCTVGKLLDPTDQNQAGAKRVQLPKT